MLSLLETKYLLKHSTCSLTAPVRSYACSLFCRVVQFVHLASHVVDELALGVQ